MKPSHLLRLLLVLVAAPACVDDTLGSECPEGQVQEGGDCVPACTPLTCEPGRCDTFSDGCAALVTCPSCGDGEVCGAGNACEPCTAKGCDELGLECGWADDGCGRQQDCGGCRVGECITVGAEANQCPCAPPATRFLALLEDPEDSTRADVNATSPALLDENGAWTLYFASNLWTSVPGTSYTALARVRMLSPTEVDRDTIVLVPGTNEGIGWMGAPTFSSSGLELFVPSTHPDAGDGELYHRSRASLADDWSPPDVIASLGSPDVPDDRVGSPLLFPDGRTLLYSRADGNADWPTLARRSTDDPSDLDFTMLPDPPFEDFGEGTARGVGNFILSCDGTRVLYTREWRDAANVLQNEQREIPVDLTTDPPTFGTPAPYGRLRLVRPGPAEGDRILRFTEAPDCSTVYFGTFAGELYYQPLTCTD